MTKYLVQVGRDARIYYSAKVHANSLEEAKSKLSRHGYRCPDETIWIEDGTDVFDNVETCNISDNQGNRATYSSNDGWGE